MPKQNSAMERTRAAGPAGLVLRRSASRRAMEACGLIERIVHEGVPTERWRWVAGVMRWDRNEPCESCPYRKGARLQFWDKLEFDNLQRQDAEPVTGNMFACHGTRKLARQSNCAGWLLDQQRRGLPSIQLRLALIRNPEAASCLRAVHDGGHEMYDSIEDMVEAQGYEEAENG